MPRRLPLGIPNETQLTQPQPQKGFLWGLGVVVAPVLAEVLLCRFDLAGTQTVEYEVYPRLPFGPTPNTPLKPCRVWIRSVCQSS